MEQNQRKQEEEKQTKNRKKKVSESRVSARKRHSKSPTLKQLSKGAGAGYFLDLDWEVPQISIAYPIEIEQEKNEK